MANHPSAEKATRQAERRRLVNRRNATRLRTELKRLRKAITSGNAAEAGALLRPTLSVIDHSVTHGALHRNAAARHKSRLTRHVNKLTARPA